MSRLEAWLSGFWTAAYQPARAYLLLRGLYLMLAGDLWLGMIEHGARYGVGGFNVAHFAWLDRIIPLPSAGLYLGLLIFSGSVSLMLALGPAPRWLRATLAVTYTFAWLISIHDSYQHHYLLSWLLVWCIACPDLCAVDARGPGLHPAFARARPSTLQGAEPVALVRGWGLPMTAMTCAIVYAFTGISKSEPEWRSGDVLKTLTHSAPMGAEQPGKFDGLRDLLVSVGVPEASVWPLLALSTVALQWTIALGYLLAPSRDARPGRARVTLVSVGLLGALSFHAVAELFEVFEIGIFSYYMIWIAMVLLAPVSLLAPLVIAPAAIGRWLGKLFPDDGRVGLTTALASAALFATTGFLIPLPGAITATACVGAVSAAWILLASSGGEPSERATPVRSGSERDDARALRPVLTRNLAVSALLLWLAITKTTVVFDYYRRGAGELARMGRIEAALEMYRLAELHAPPGESRRARIVELESQLRQQDAGDRKVPVKERTLAPAPAQD